MAMAGTQIARKPLARHWMLLSAVLLLVAATVLPPLINISRYQHRIAESISRSVGRPVRMNNVRLRLLPRPGFEIEDLVVSEDPAFGAEPMLHASTVVASIRLVSLWRGRLEIARISFDEASLNLVRDAAGQWNVGSALTQASRIPNSPTAQRHAGGAPRFPYIEATNARINFKLGNVKQPFSFLNSELTVWLDRPDQWQVRFEAQPDRTDLDLNLSDTGLLQVEGTLGRATSLGAMPVNLQADWSNASFGQLSRLLMGEDTGWRGALDVHADIHGTPDDPMVKARLRGSGVHRVEFQPPQALDLDTTCQAAYSRAMRVLHDLTCFSPAGEGHLLLTGSIASLPGTADPDLKLRLQHLPVGTVLAALRTLRSGFAPSLSATGNIDGDFTYSGPSPSLEGQATVNNLSIAAPGLSKPMPVPAFPVKATAPDPQRARTQTAAITSLEIPSVSLAMGGAAPATLSARLDAAGFDVHLAGTSSLDRVIQLSRALGIGSTPLTSFTPQGTADLQLGVQGAWVLPVPDAEHPAAPVGMNGTIRLHNAAVAPGFLASPLQVQAALGTVTSSQIAWAPVSIVYGKMHADGAYTQPVFCINPDGCKPSFDLHTDSISAAELQSTLLGGKHGQMLEEILDRLNGHSYAWPALHGRIHAGTFSIDKLKLQNATAALSIDGNHLEIESLQAQTLGGDLQVSGTLDAGGNRPVYVLDARLSHADPAQVADLFDENWGSGTFNFSSQLHLTGFTADQLASSVQGKFHWDWLSGSLPVEEDALPDLEPVSHFDRWTADGVIANNRLNLTRSMLVHEGDELPMAGTLSFDRELQLRVDDPERPLDIGGTLERPRVSGPKGPKPTPAAFRKH